jgi:hypothetical protein
MMERYGHTETIKHRYPKRLAPSGMGRPKNSMKMNVFWDVAPCSMEEVSTSENISQFLPHYMARHLHTDYYENLKSHQKIVITRN